MYNTSELKKYLAAELADNVLSDKCRQEWELFDSKEQEYIMAQLIELYDRGDNMTTFRNCISHIFPESFMYLHKKVSILLYPGIGKSRLVQRKIDAIIHIFLPIGTNVEIFWEKHFGVIGVEETMQLDEIELY